MILLNVCLSDIPKENITTGKNGKEYVNLMLDERRDVGRFGETHSICLTQTKEMREAKESKVYVVQAKSLLSKREKNKHQHAPFSNQNKLNQVIRLMMVKIYLFKKNGYE